MNPLLPVLHCFTTMIAFAANSVLCRLSLKTYALDPLDFTLIRLLSGALILLPILLRKPNFVQKPTWESTKAAIGLFSYALFFSFAYVQIDAGTGALILFTSVQFTMIGVSICYGNRLNRKEWIGFLLAFLGLFYLLLPGIEAPPLLGSLLMIISGISWGMYSLWGKGAEQPIATTARNFLFAGVISVLIGLFYLKGIDFSNRGVQLAIVSGAITSGVGYVLWYVTLNTITTTLASVVQLSVPIVAAIGGVVFISETLTSRLILSTGAVLLGILLIIFSREPKKIEEDSFSKT